MPQSVFRTLFILEIWNIVTLNNNSLFNVHPCCSMCQNFLLFLRLIIFHCTHHLLLIHSTISGHLGYFHVLAVVNNALSRWVYKNFFETLVSFLLGIYPEVELLIIWFFCVYFFEDPPYCFMLFSKVVAPFYNPMNRYNFSISSLTMVIFNVFDSSHTNGCKVISHCSFDLHFPND